MSRLLDDEQDELPQRERELTLSTGSILAIFLGLVLLCAVFFGFGYNMGRKSSPPSAALPAATTDNDSAQTSDSTFDNFKPSPVSPPAQPNTPAATAASSPPPVSASPAPASAPPASAT